MWSTLSQASCRTLLAALAFVLLGLQSAASSHAAQPGPPAIVWTQLAPQVWFAPGAVAEPSPSNLGDVSNHLFVQDDKADPPLGWLVGAGASPAVGAMLRDSLAQQLGATVTDVISARAHPESVLGTTAFTTPSTNATATTTTIPPAPARHWAIPEVAAAMARRCPNCLARLKGQTLDASLNEGVLQLPGALPTHTLASAGVHGPFEVLALRVNVTEWTTVLHHRDSGYWFTPGLAWGQALWPVGTDTDSTVLISSLKQVISRMLIVNSLLYIPEQGIAETFNNLQVNLDYWQNLKAKMRLAANHGQSVFDALRTEASQPAPAKLNPAQHGLNVQRLWREAEAEFFEGQSTE